MIYFIVIVVALICLYLIAYNGIASLKQKVIESWAGIDVQLKRRQDLIPNLVETVKEYAAYEKNLLEEITRLRSEAIQTDSKNLQQKSATEKHLGDMINKFFAVAEAYPNLKASEDFMKLQKELTNTEDQIASSRRIYNQNVANFNTKLSIFPTNLIAKINNCTPYTFFQNS